MVRLYFLGIRGYQNLVSSTKIQHSLMLRIILYLVSLKLWYKHASDVRGGKVLDNVFYSSDTLLRDVQTPFFVHLKQLISA